ncbi:hypothetical protein AW863_RS10695 [Acinetobacter baumannii]|uniref:hypothetical protein n=1 Tax=Acinetobacter baumannii TaxID=470 RepID=UPI000B435EEE|nr:hypothetical protein [Acinetobacter baumannii]EHU1571486.1 hypothetical protein [Acinetobacter baumannii]EHU1626648.1 hypothetical protein [Acinetobacter baumannii]EHU1651108.1 hypothetical protein [Acinetobacter baumannii]EHU1816946.1 hypothetical protein [Acinetobacter baumannii]EHU1882353.1 hypothetical protein [Acinetobacter baumannii]
MRAQQFIKDHGLEKAREVVEGWRDRSFDDSFNIQDGVYCNLPFEPTDDCETLGLFELKLLVESVDLVESWGGIDDVKLYDLSHCKNRPESAGYKLLQAIKDHESIYGEE